MAKIPPAEQLAAVETFLLHGGSVIITDKYGTTAACLATDRVQGAVVKVLLGSNPSATQWNKRDGKTPLYIAAVKGNLSVVRDIGRLVAIRLRCTAPRPLDSWGRCDSCCSTERRWDSHTRTAARRCSAWSSTTTKQSSTHCWSTERTLKA